ncbi:hypothetical protein FRC11_007155, partial [Ceratobasidium sp. 423]
MEAAMQGSDVEFRITGRQIDKALAPDPSLWEWLGDLPQRSHLMVILITETSHNGWWTNRIGTIYDRNELLLLYNLFVEDPDIYHPIQNLRSAYLFVVSCGTNLTAGKPLPHELHRWNRQHDLFDHIVCLTNTRLRIQETIEMFGVFPTFAYKANMPFKQALMSAWAADRHARYHTGLLWITKYKSLPKVIQLHTRMHPYGWALQDVSWYCKCGDPDKNWQARKPRKEPTKPVLWWQSSCCGLQVWMRFKELPPTVTTVMGIGCVFDTWPATPSFELSIVKPEEREARRSVAEK